GFVVLVQHEGTGVLRGRAALPLALLGGAVTFLVITGLYRSGRENGLALVLEGFGPERARAPRYLHIVAALTLPAIALAADALVRRWRAALIGVVIFFLGALPRTL